MRAVLKGDQSPTQLICRWLDEGNRVGNYGPAFTILRAEPGLALANDVQPRLERCLANPFVVTRFNAARVLAWAGDRRGIDELVFNALPVHPVLGFHETADWRFSLVPFVEMLEDRHIELLLADFPSEHNDQNIVALSASQRSVADSGLRELLRSPDARVRRRAAYVLGWHGDPCGNDVLLEWVADLPSADERLNPLVPAFRNEIGTAHMNLIQQLCRVSDGRYANDSTGIKVKVLLPGIRFVRDLVGSACRKERQATWDSAFRFEIAEVKVFPTPHLPVAMRKLKRPVEVYGIQGRISFARRNQGPEFLMGFFDEQDRQIFAERNRKAVAQLLDFEGLTFEELLDARYLPMMYKMELTGYEPEARYATNFADGVRIVYELNDYVAEATDWIVRPAKHRAN